MQFEEKKLSSDWVKSVLAVEQRSQWKTSQRIGIDYQAEEVTAKNVITKREEEVVLLIRLFKYNKDIKKKERVGVYEKRFD